MTVTNFKPRTLVYIEYLFIYRTMVYFNWNRSKAAKSLGISIRGLRNKLYRMQRIGISVENKKGHKLTYSVNDHINLSEIEALVELKNNIDLSAC